MLSSGVSAYIMKKNVRDVLHNIRIGILSSTEKMIKILSKDLFHTT